eukprot:m.28718 g.28718  ORF g.28718 m.28718 type:complete len:343 (-) comp5007_c0_seq1:49-1077(-)
MASNSALPGNYVAASAPGCHVAWLDAPWILRTAPYDADEFGLGPDEVPPDFAVDPEDGLLTVINPTSDFRSYFVSVRSTLRNGEGEVLLAGSARDEDGTEASCTTLVLLLRPRSVMDVAYVDLGDSGDADDTGSEAGEAEDADEEGLAITSDVKDLDGAAVDAAAAVQRTVAEVSSLPVLQFPLGPPPAGAEQGWLCSQGFGGHFTHFYPGTLHAVDLECPVGTPVVAVADGTVVEVRSQTSVSGIEATNLFSWNSVMLQLDGTGHFAEYVHVARDSCTLAVGDRVRAGQVICRSGDAGFCPQPHLHVQLHHSREPDAPTVPFCFRLADGSIAIPMAGQRYQ